MKLVINGRLDPSLFTSHRFPLADTMAAYDTFADPATSKALKVVLEGTETVGALPTELVGASVAG